MFVHRLSTCLLLATKDEAKFTMFRFDDFVKGISSFQSRFLIFFLFV